MTESRHCDDYIDDPSTPEVLRAFLSHGRSPGHGMGRVAPVLFATYLGKEPWMDINPGDRVRVVMASRMGDVGVTKKLDATSGYSARFFLDMLGEFSAEAAPRWFFTRDLELVGVARLVDGGLQIDGVVIAQNGYRVRVNGTLRTEPDEWKSKELIGAVTITQKKSPPIQVTQAELDEAKAQPLSLAKHMEYASVDPPLRLSEHCEDAYCTAWNPCDPCERVKRSR